MARRQALQEEATSVHSGPCNLPMYTNQLAFPGHISLVNFLEAQCVPYSLNPLLPLVLTAASRSTRHRLMLRRILNRPTSSEPELGMILPPRYAVPGEADYGFGYGTLARIKSVQLLPDDRSVCEVEAIGRFRVLQTQGLDGYALARVEM